MNRKSTGGAINRALISVSDKRGIVAFARALAALDVEILSTGGTARALSDAGVAVTAIADYTGLPELMDGRVKTLHPKIHGGILARAGVDDDDLAAHKIGVIDLVAVNLYPFRETVAQPDCKLQEAIENIDIGGPAMLRGAAKNYAETIVLTDPDDYEKVLGALQKSKRVDETLRFTLAQKAFAHTAEYDAAIAKYLCNFGDETGNDVGDFRPPFSRHPRTALPVHAKHGNGQPIRGSLRVGTVVAERDPRRRLFSNHASRGENISFEDDGRREDDGNGMLVGGDTDDKFPPTLYLQLRKKQALRYGENPHQAAAFYVDDSVAGSAAGNPDRTAAGIANAQQIQGKDLSFNNIADADAALQCAREFPSQTPVCVIVKHANPCGVALADAQISAYQRAFATDPESAFGGVIAFNATLAADTAEAITGGQFAEVIIAPKVTADAAEVLAAKPKIRVLECAVDDAADGYDIRTVSGGLLVQTADDKLHDELQIVSKRAPDDAEMDDLIFAWTVAKFVKSNAIVYAAKRATVGVGAGQMSRVNSARIAAIKAAHAGLKVRGAVLASDAFFPFRDALDSAAEAGIRALIQPGGALRDDEIIAAADAHDMAMVFTGMRHFRH